MDFNPFGMNSRSLYSGQTRFGSLSQAQSQVQDENYNSRAQLKRASGFGGNRPTTGFPRKNLQNIGGNETQGKNVPHYPSKNSLQPSKKPRRALGDISNQNLQSNTSGLTGISTKKKGLTNRYVPCSKKLNSVPLLSQQLKPASCQPPLAPKAKTKIFEDVQISRPKEKSTQDPEQAAGRLWDPERAWHERLASVEEETYPIEKLPEINFEEEFKRKEQEHAKKLEADLQKVVEEDKKRLCTALFDTDKIFGAGFPQLEISDYEVENFFLPAINCFESDIEDIFSQESNEYHEEEKAHLPPRINEGKETKLKVD